MRSATRKQVGRNAEYLNFIRSLPCAVCPYGTQASKTESAHIGERGMSEKCPDTEAIPLCGIAHHREGPESQHRLGKRFWDIHSLDREKLIAMYNALFEEQYVNSGL